jgi:hypothetical protein
MAAHRIKIRELMIEKEVYTQKYLEEKRKYDDLLSKVNSTSTVGSISTVLTEHLEAEPSSDYANKVNDTTHTSLHPELDLSDGNSENSGNHGASKETRLKIDSLERHTSPQSLSDLGSLTSDNIPNTATVNGLILSSGRSSGRRSLEQNDIIVISQVSTPDMFPPVRQYERLINRT